MPSPSTNLLTSPRSQKKNYDNKDFNHEDDEEIFDEPMKIGIAVGVFAIAVIIIIVIVVWIEIKKKRNRVQESHITITPDEDYYEQPVDNHLKYTGQQQPGQEYAYAVSDVHSSLTREEKAEGSKGSDALSHKKDLAIEKGYLNPKKESSSSTIEKKGKRSCEERTKSENKDEPFYVNISETTKTSNRKPICKDLEGRPCADIPEYLELHGDELCEAHSSTNNVEVTEKYAESLEGPMNFNTYKNYGTTQEFGNPGENPEPRATIENGETHIYGNIQDSTPHEHVHQMQHGSDEEQNVCEDQEQLYSNVEKQGSQLFNSADGGSGEVNYGNSVVYGNIDEEVRRNNCDQSNDADQTFSDQIYVNLHEL